MLITASEIVEKSWGLYKKNWRSLLAYLLLLLLPSIVLSILGVISLFLTAYVPASALLNNLIILLIVAAGVVFALWASIALAQTLKKLAQNQPAGDWRAVFVDNSRYLWPVIYTSALVAVIIFAGAMLLIIPGIIFGVWYSFVFYQVIFEDKKGVGALKESKKLVMGRWWAILWRLLVPAVVFGLFAILINYLLDLPFYFIFGPGSTITKITNNIVSSLINVAVSPLTALATILLYLNAKETLSAAPNLDEIK